MGNRLSRIYTRTGDDGTTGLGDGTRVRKDHARVEAYGTVDEANSAIGLILSVPGLPADVARCLTEIQHDLFDLGGELCIPGTKVIKAEQIVAARAGARPVQRSAAARSRISSCRAAGRARRPLPSGENHRAARGTLRVDAGGGRAGQRRGAEVPEPPVGPAVRDRARAGASRAWVRSAVAPRPRPVKKRGTHAGCESAILARRRAGVLAKRGVERRLRAETRFDARSAAPSSRATPSSVGHRVTHAFEVHEIVEAAAEILVDHLGHVVRVLAHLRAQTRAR